MIKVKSWHIVRINPDFYPDNNWKATNNHVFQITPVSHFKTISINTKQLLENNMVNRKLKDTSLTTLNNSNFWSNKILETTSQTVNPSFSQAKKRLTTFNQTAQT